MPTMDNLVTGQVAEFLVWTELIEQSQGQLHVFLPLWDRGIDGLVHNRASQIYTPLQVKARSVLAHGTATFVVRGNAMTDDKAVLILAHIDRSHLDPYVVVIEEGRFRELAAQSSNAGYEVFEASIRLPPKAGTLWAQYVIRTADLAARLGGSLGQPTLVEGIGPLGRALPDKPMGIRGEAEVIRRLTDEGALNIFRPFPDLESAEIAVRHVETFQILGLQVKTTGAAATGDEVTVNTKVHSFDVAANTWLLALNWLRDANQFHPECLVIPSAEIPRIGTEREKYFHFQWTPGGGRHSMLEPYRRPLESLGHEVAMLLGGLPRDGA